MPIYYFVDLKEKLKSLEIQNQRLCEVFKKKSHDFRDAMYMLFGYKIDVLSTNQYRLCSQYAFDPQDILLFQVIKKLDFQFYLLTSSIFIYITF